MCQTVSLKSPGGSGLGGGLHAVVDGVGFAVEDALVAITGRLDVFTNMNDRAEGVIVSHIC